MLSSTESQNQSINMFLILGFPNTRKVEIALFFVFLTMYLLTVTGNIIIIITVNTDNHLQTPMYFFLGNLSLLDIGYTSSTVPKLLSILLMNVHLISLVGCLLQSYFFFFFGSAECFLLSVMAYDRYMAICYPLRYPIIMNRRICIVFVIVCWISGCVAPLIAAIMVINLPFCGTNIINHFFCDIPPLLKLACIDTSLIQQITFLLSAMVILSTFLCTIISYIYIGITILKIPSSHGRHKAFSTCASHLTVVSLYYGTVIFMYVSPTTRSSFDLNKVIAVIYSVVTPMLNPMIYTLRNQDMKTALKRMFRMLINRKEFELSN
ncbi:olfactory receptor 6M1-like [Protobothrops mucrosquamatus]|uniref:olfactory receptor 6M1-like n=1 Tax=Protobothrops mucrosquamatus TaxID=103944 RepID=UPI0010FB0B11|nr:olfactory receptor 6M1-like [Protobothrops mucrosquamatus]